MLLTHDRIIIWDQQADCKHREDEEENEAVNDTSDGLGNIPSRVHSLGSTVGDKVWATNGERSSIKDAPDGQKAAGIAVDVLCIEGAGVIPVPEANAIVLRVSSDNHDEGEQEESYHEKYLEDGCAEFDFAKIFDRETVQDKYNGESAGYPYTGIDIRKPVGPETSQCCTVSCNEDPDILRQLNFVHEYTGQI